jgi:hypothetical protein
MKNILFICQKHVTNVFTLGQAVSDKNNEMITLTEKTLSMWLAMKMPKRLWKSDNIN